MIYIGRLGMIYDRFRRFANPALRRIGLELVRIDGDGRMVGVGIRLRFHPNLGKEE